MTKQDLIAVSVASGIVLACAFCFLWYWGIIP